MALYIHYGSASFNPSYFTQVSNREHRNKPCGGFWASRVEAKCGWRNWCESERFGLDSLNTHFRFLITPAAKVYHLYTSKDLDLLPRRNDSIDWEFFPDFEQMMKDGWDAIELHLSSTDENWDHDGLYWRLYGWDCDSILIMNPKIISPLTHI